MLRGGVLVTGASGFVGGELCRVLSGTCEVKGASRDFSFSRSLEGVEFVRGYLSADFNWIPALGGIDTVVHCAARVHVMNEQSPNPLAEFRSVNVDGTLRLARQAAEVGVRRFIFVSSIKVNGECSSLGTPFTADQQPTPSGPYAVSKCEAEVALRVLALQTGMELVIIRPPLVYGPGSKGNFLTLMRWLSRGIPLPLGGVVANRRSLVFVSNLVDLIATCIDHPAAANQTFLVSDGEDLSTAELLFRTAGALGRPARLIPIPSGWIVLGAKIVGGACIAQRLCGSLEIDIGKTREVLGWSPPMGIDEGLQITADYWLRLQAGRRGGNLLLD